MGVQKKKSYAKRRVTKDKPVFAYTERGAYALSFALTGDTAIEKGDLVLDIFLGIKHIVEHKGVGLEETRNMIKKSTREIKSIWGFF